MSGIFSREKGRRGEHQLVIYLLKRGFQSAERILKQYQKAGYPDVTGIKDGTTYTFEIKYRGKGVFSDIYRIYLQDKSSEDILCFINSGTAVAVSFDLNNLYKVDSVFMNVDNLNLNIKDRRAYDKISKLKKKWLGSANFLVLKENNRPNIFMRFW